MAVRAAASARSWSVRSELSRPRPWNSVARFVALMKSRGLAARFFDQASMDRSIRSIEPVAGPVPPAPAIGASPGGATTAFVAVPGTGAAPAGPAERLDAPSADQAYEATTMRIVVARNPESLGRRVRGMACIAVMSY